MRLRSIDGRLRFWRVTAALCTLGAGLNWTVLFTTNKPDGFTFLIATACTWLAVFSIRRALIWQAERDRWLP